MKPYVICHMMGLLHGQLLVEQWTPSAGRLKPDFRLERQSE
jgi:hypothetical protein